MKSRTTGKILSGGDCSALPCTTQNEAFFSVDAKIKGSLGSRVGEVL